MPEATALLQLFGADDEIRTRDLNLGKVALYQLSYIRLLIFQMPFFLRAMQIYSNPEDKSKPLDRLFFYFFANH